MSRRITRALALAAAAVAIPAAVVAGVATASASPGDQAYHGDGLYLTAVGPIAQIHPASAGFKKCTTQSGSEANASFRPDALSIWTFDLRWSDNGVKLPAHYYVSVSPAGVHFTHAIDASSTLRQLGDGEIISNTGYAIKLGPASGGVISGISAVPMGQGTHFTAESC